MIEVYYGTSGSGPRVEVLHVGQYPDGTPLVDEIVTPLDRPVRIMVRTSDLREFMSAMFWVDAMADRGKKPTELVIPMFPGARQDRLNDAGDQLFTAKSVAREINARNFKRVVVVDCHSDVVPALVNRCVNVKPAYFAPKFRDVGAINHCAVVAPDGGAEKRAWGVAKALGLPLLHAWKTRDVSTGKLTGFGMEPTDGVAGRVLVVDDICDGGGTFLGLGEVIDDRCLRADLYVTHGLFTKGLDDLRKYYQKIITTDTVYAASDLDVDTINICDDLLTKGTL